MLAIGQDSALELGMEHDAIPNQPPQPQPEKQIKFWVLREKGNWELIETSLQLAVARVREITGSWAIRTECK